MAFIRTEFEIDVDANRAWRVNGDWASGRVGMARGHVVSSEAEGAIRVLAFAKSTIARECLVARDEAACRMVYPLIGDPV